MSTERLSDNKVDWWALGYTRHYGPTITDTYDSGVDHEAEITAMARELQERRQADKDDSTVAPAPLFMLLDVWQALGLPPNDFHGWVDGTTVTVADAWAQLLGAIAGRSESLASDTNPPAPHALIQVAIEREVDAVAPVQVDDTPNPYRFTVDLSEAAFGKGWQVGLWFNGIDLWWSDVFVDHDDAREHADLIARALREVTVDEG